MKLSALFGHHAVFQRDLPIPIWGWTNPLTRVRATLAGCTVENMAGPTGAFLLRRPPHPAGGPHRLTVATPDPGEQVVVEDWRRNWGQGDFPFCAVRIASARDLGDALDIHPCNKRDVGFRLAQWALVAAYGRQGPATGPRYAEPTFTPAGAPLHEP